METNDEENTRPQPRTGPASPRARQGSKGRERPHVVVLNRWQDEYARFADCIDHDRYAVSYLTTPLGAHSVPAGAASATVLATLDDLDVLRKEIEELVPRFGAPHAVVALKEDDLLKAAVLRQEWGCPGPAPADLSRFLDKGEMLSHVHAAGIALPAFHAAPDARTVCDFADQYGWPVVVKPRIGVASDHVRRLWSASDAEAVDFGERRMLVQQNNPHDVYHVDGVRSGGRLLTWRASRYLHTCLSFRNGSVQDTVEEDDPRLLAAIGDFTEQVLDAMGAADLVFHLEIFVDPGSGRSTGPAGTDSGGEAEDPRCWFLEIAARPGGAETPFIWREVHRYDLMRAAFAIAMGRPVPSVHPEAPRGGGGEYAGYLLVPPPPERPCRVVAATSMLGRDQGPYAEVLPPVGGVMVEGGGVYEHVGGRFRFRGPDKAAITAAIDDTARHYRFDTDPVPAGG